MSFVEVGQKAPDFTLEGLDRQPIKLADFAGKRVLISWHPLAFTGICGDQVRDLARNYERIKDKGVDVILSVSVDPAPAKKTWATGLDVNTDQITFASDFEPKGAMSKAYGVYMDEFGMSTRATVLIDKEGKVEWANLGEMTVLPDIENIIANC